jgi:hypothetical protein
MNNQTHQTEYCNDQVGAHLLRDLATLREGVERLSSLLTGAAFDSVVKCSNDDPIRESAMATWKDPETVAYRETLTAALTRIEQELSSRLPNTGRHRLEFLVWEVMRDRNLKLIDEAILTPHIMKANALSGQGACQARKAYDWIGRDILGALSDSRDGTPAPLIVDSQGWFKKNPIYWGSHQPTTF